MALTMKLSMLGLGPKIGGSKDAPRASANVLIQDIDPAYNVADVQQKVIEFVAPTVNFTVPSGGGTTLYETTVLRLVSSGPPEFIDHKTAVCPVEWGLVTAAALVQPDPANPGQTRQPSQTPETETLGPEYTIDTTAGTKHITQSVWTRYAIKKGGTGNFSAPSYNRAIGVTKDGVEGCDIPTGDMRWSVRVKGIPVTHKYIKTLKELTGKINTYEFYNRKREELLFLGAQLNYKPGVGWEGTYNFHESEEQTNVPIADGITIPVVRGHDYVWVTYVPTEITVGANKYKAQVPDAAYCEQVIETRDFDRLGI